MKNAKNLCNQLFFFAFTLLIACSKDEPKVPTVLALSCASATLSSSANANSSYTGTVTLPYEGGNGLSYPLGSTIPSTGVTGLTAILKDSARTLANGAGNLTFNITGTPSTSGIAKFAISFGGQTCNVEIPVFTLIGNWKRTTTVRSGIACKDVDSETCAQNCNIAFTATALSDSSTSIPYLIDGNKIMFSTPAGAVTLTFTVNASTLVLYSKAGTQGDGCDRVISYVKA
jgi:hypothetical protein